MKCCRLVLAMLLVAIFLITFGTACASRPAETELQKKSQKYVEAHEEAAKLVKLAELVVLYVESAPEDEQPKALEDAKRAIEKSKAAVAAAVKARDEYMAALDRASR